MSARLPLPALDVIVLSIAGAAAWVIWATWSRRWSVRPQLFVGTLVVGAAMGWLAFLVLWGWHYQVPTLEARLGVTADQLSRARATVFVQATIDQLNGSYTAAHAQRWPGWGDLPATLRPHLERVLPTLSVPRTPVLSPPRRSILDSYFRWAGIDGVTNPYGLEVVINSRVLSMELPALVAHEYAHLAGFADESDASVVAWLTCQDGDASLRYSAALAVLPHVLTGLPREERRRLMGQLQEGPRRDLQAIAARLQEQKPWVHAFAWATYDKFLKANRVEEGIARYDAVARVLIGATDPTTGRLQRSPSPWPPAR